MLFAMVYAKLLKMVLLQLALNGMFPSSEVIDLSRSPQVKSNMAPHLKINLMVCRMAVVNFMLCHNLHNRFA